jgi:hypothetical protein
VGISTRIHIKSRVAPDKSLRRRNDNNTNPTTTHKYMVNQTRMPLLRIFCQPEYLPACHSNSLDRAESSRSRTLDRSTFTERLWHDPSRGNTSHSRNLPNDPDIPSTLMAKACPAAPTRASDTTQSALLWKGLGQHCFGPANIGILQKDTKLPKLQFGAQPISHIIDWAGTHWRSDPRIASLESAFNCSRHTIPSALANRLNEPKSRGRHWVFGGERGI